MGSASLDRFDGPPKRVKFKKSLTLTFLKSIDVDGTIRDDGDHFTVWFYNDRTNPFNHYKRKSEKQKMQDAYFARLTKLCEYLDYDQ